MVERLHSLEITVEVETNKTTTRETFDDVGAFIAWAHTFEIEDTPIFVDEVEAQIERLRKHVDPNWNYIDSDDPPARRLSDLLDRLEHKLDEQAEKLKQARAVLE